MNPFELEPNPEVGRRVPLVFEHASKEQIEQAEKELNRQAEEQREAEERIRRRNESARTETEPRA
jgi:hypothetical protein